VLLVSVVVSCIEVVIRTIFKSYCSINLILYLLFYFSGIVNCIGMYGLFCFIPFCIFFLFSFYSLYFLCIFCLINSGV
jgi:hypothetical protein